MALEDAPAVVMLGPRQVGKTTLAHQLTGQPPPVYLDLESEGDRARLQEPELYLEPLEGSLVVLDEIQRMPDLFQSLRGLIDRGRGRGRRTGRFLLLGSASLDLLRQSSESLAGRITQLELTPITGLEAGVEHLDSLWVRGGFPDSLLARDERASTRWRQSFIRTYLERDIPQLGPRIPAETLRRFWTMLAHQQGAVLNAAPIARALGVTGKTVASYLDLMVDLLLLRRLQPWHRNVGKRLVKSPKVYVRDSGLVHSLLGIPDLDGLLGHPIAGMTWEGLVIESLIACVPRDWEPAFYRTSAGAEIDLVLVPPGAAPWAIEVKRSASPRLERGFHSACDDIAPAQRFVVYPGRERFPLPGGAEAIDLVTLCGILRAQAAGGH
nr:ATP-binding protein [Luteitalea pratensis]